MTRLEDFMDPAEQVKILSEALRQIGLIAVPDGDENAMPALLEAQHIADEALHLTGQLP
jgi:hypothetical protein